MLNLWVKLALESPPLLAAMLASVCVMAVAAALTTTKAQCHDLDYFPEFHGILIIWLPKAPFMLNLRVKLALESPPLLAAMLASACVMAVAAALTTTKAQCRDLE